MSEKKKTIAEQADDIRQELDALIGDSPLDVENDPKTCLFRLNQRR